MESCNNSPHLPNEILIESRKIISFFYRGNTENTTVYFRPNDIIKVHYNKDTQISKFVLLWRPDQAISHATDVDINHYVNAV